MKNKNIHRPFLVISLGLAESLYLNQIYRQVAANLTGRLKLQETAPQRTKHGYSMFKMPVLPTCTTHQAQEREEKMPH